MAYDEAGSTVLSLLYGLAKHDADLRQQKLEAFACQYTQPLVSFLCKTKRMDANDAVDLVQEFWLAKMIQREPSANLISNYLRFRGDNPARESGSFRRYLLRALSNYYLDHVRRQKKETNAGTLDEVAFISKTDCTVFDAAWANAILRAVVTGVKEECLEKQQTHMWKLFCRQIVVPPLTGGQPPGYAALASEFGYTDARAAANAVRTVIRKFQSHLRICVRDYLPTQHPQGPDASLEEECSELLGVLSLSGALDKTMFGDVVPWSEIRELTRDDVPELSDSQSSSGLSFFSLVESRLYLTDADIHCRWGQILPTAIDSWLESAGVVGNPKIETTFGELIKGKAVPLPGLKLIRDCAKSLARECQDESPLVLAAIYLSTIASAFERHGCVMSSDPAEKIVLRLRQVLTYQWLDSDTRELLSSFAGKLPQTK